jgi:hypothetical protein
MISSVAGGGADEASADMSDVMSEEESAGRARSGGENGA